MESDIFEARLSRNVAVQRRAGVSPAPLGRQSERTIRTASPPHHLVGVRNRSFYPISHGWLGRRDACPTFNCIFTAKACQRSGLQWAAIDGDRHSSRCRTGDVFVKDDVVPEFCRMRLRQPQIAGLKALNSARVNQSGTWHRSCQTFKTVMTNSNILLMKTKLTSHSKYLRTLYIASL